MIDNRILLEGDLTFMMTEDDEYAIEQEGPYGGGWQVSQSSQVNLRRPVKVLPATECVCLP